MLFADVHFQFLCHLSTQTIVRQHAFDSMFKHHLRLRFHDILDRLEASSPRIEGVVIILLQILPLPGDNDLLSVDDDDEITKIRIGCERRLVLAPDNMRNLRGDAPHRFAAGIDQEPLLLNMLGREEFSFWCGIHSTSKSMYEFNFELLI